MKPELEIRGLEVTLGGRRVLGPLDLDVASGEHVLLVGRSGCGKSTLLRAIAGLVAPSAGTIALAGERASEPGRVRIAPEHRGVGMLFQGAALWPHLSAAKTLRFVLRARGLARGNEPARIAELLSWVELAGFEDRMPATLSGGEAQRLALARALASEPRLLLLDEPLGPLDAELRGALLERLATLHRQLHCTMLHVTHDPHEVEGLADRTLTLDAGRLCAAAEVAP